MGGLIQFKQRKPTLRLIHGSATGNEPKLPGLIEGAMREALERKTVPPKGAPAIGNFHTLRMKLEVPGQGGLIRRCLAEHFASDDLDRQLGAYTLLIALGKDPGTRPHAMLILDHVVASKPGPETVRRAITTLDELKDF